jgi:hypothetical protein
MAGKGDGDAMHPALATPVGDRARTRLMCVALPSPSPCL